MIHQFGIHDILYLLNGAGWTLILSAVTMIGGGLIGFSVALMRISSSQVLRGVAVVYIELIQSTPVLMVVFLVYFGPGIFGIELPKFPAAALALVVYSSAFFAEIWRGAIQSVPRPQWEASSALSLTWLQQLRYVILPQAVRVSLPPTVGFMVQVVKNTSVTSIVGFVDVSRAGQLISNATFQPFRVYLWVAAIYFVVCYPMSVISRRIERRFNVRR